MENSDINKKLLEIQKVIADPSKSQDNPYFKSKYEDLREVRNVIQAAMEASGIWLLNQQFPSTNYEKIQERNKRSGNGDQVTSIIIKVPYVSVRTAITDIDSGSKIEHEIGCYPSDDTPQAIKSVITYLRRTAYLCLYNLAPSDDDGNAGSDRDDFDQRPRQTNGNASKKAPTNKPANEPQKQKPKEQPVQAQQEPAKTPTDQEQEKAGRIIGKQVDLIADLCKQKKVSGDCLKAWLKTEYPETTGNRWLIKKEHFAAICNVIMNSPQDIDFNAGAK